MADDLLGIPKFLKRPLPEGTTLSEEVRRANEAVRGMPGGRFLGGSIKTPPKRAEVPRHELSDAEAVKLAQREAKFVAWQTTGKPGAGKKAALKKRIKSRTTAKGRKRK